MARTQIDWPEGIFDDLDREGRVPLYYQIATKVEAAIRSGAIPAGSRIENEIALGERLGVSRPTVRRAIQELADKGLLVRRRGAGTQVVQGQVTRQVELTSLYEDLKSTKHQPGTRVLIRELRATPADIAQHLGLDEGDDALYIRRQRSTDGTPVAILENWLPTDFANITSEALERQGLYEILRASGVRIQVAKQRIGARREHGDEADLLDIDRGSALLTMERIAYDATGKAVEFGHHCYRPDMYSFETTLVAR